MDISKEISAALEKSSAIRKMFETGLSFTMPRGAFYFFPVVPGGNDEKFCDFLQKNYHILVVAGHTFGRLGQFRLSYSVPDQVIVNSKKAWQKGVTAWCNLL